MSVAGPMDGHSGHDTLYHCMKDYKHGPNSRMSITFNSSKGLTNAPGQNNCFLNSAVQVLWHLDAFRRSFRLLSGHSCMGNACIFCALKVMFTQFQYSDKQVLPPDALRQALSETFQNQQRFQMGYMDDAAECFENILTRMHNHIAPGESEDHCTVAHCLPHRKFSMSVSEQVVCGSCGTKSEPFTFNEMVFYVSTGALVNEFKSHSADELGRLSFSQLLKSTVSKGDVRSCPGSCGKTGEKWRHLTNVPDVVSIGLVWESAKSGSQHIRDVVNGIGTTLDLSEMFHSTPFDGKSGCKKALQPLHLVGVVCYYGKHYSTFFFHSKVHEWIYFDDASVKQISSSWSKVCEKLCKGRHQPLLLLYMNPNTDAVDVSSVPKFSTMAPGYEWKSEDQPDPISARTKSPAPESSKVNSKRDHLSKQDMHDSRYDEVDAVYSSRHFNKERRRHFSEKLYDRQFSSALSRQDSGVSSQSSKSQSAVENDAASRVSAALTQHSSDSGSSGHQLSRQESDTASSYCSRSSVTSTVSTFSSAVESEDTGYAGLHTSSYQNALLPVDPPKPKVSLKKKKMKNKMEADMMRYHSKSQASLLDVHNQSYDDSSQPRDIPENVETDQKSFTYATLPRKKRVTPPAPVNPVKGPDIASISLCSATTNIDDAKDMNHESQSPSISSRIQMFNGVNNQPTAATQQIKPPERKPLLNINNRSKDGESMSYISRSSVEKILNQQKKASTRTPLKMMRPTYEEEFSVPEEYIIDRKSSDVKYELSSADNSSIGSLKDSGYRSLGDRGSNSASSVSSFSTGSPTMNSSFSFDTKEHIYYEPPPMLFMNEKVNGSAVNPRDEVNDDSNAEEYEFPPPPPELLGVGNHSKQLSEASVLSEASTLRQRKTPSVESLDALPNAYITSQGLEYLSISDPKHNSMMKSAEESLEKSMEQEELQDINSALVFCQQAVGLFSAVLNQRPDDKHTERLAQSKYDYCMNRVQTLQPVQPDSRQQGRHVMCELHIDNQTRRGAASTDYTPLHNAIHRAPAAPARDSSHRLSRTDSQMSNSSTSSAGQSSTSHRSSTSTVTTCDSKLADKTVHTVPLQLQRSISQLQQKQQQEQTQQNFVSSRQDVVANKQSSHKYSVGSDQLTKPFNSQQAYRPSEVRNQQPSNSRHSSSSSLDSETRAGGSKPSNHYKEVNIPTTLQRMDYIRDGYKTRSERQGCPSPSPSVIPPPKEFQESNTHSSVESLTGGSHNARLSPRIKHVPYPQQNGVAYSAQANGYNNQCHSQPTSNHPTSYPRSVPQTSHDNNYRDLRLPPKQSINKQNIRDMLVQDMLKRKGQQGAPQIHHNTDSTVAQSVPYKPLTNSICSQRPYVDQFDEPLWTPPQQSAYDKGLSHYDRPSYQRQNLYGQVNSRQTANNRYPSSNSTQPSLYGENVVDKRRSTISQHESRINHCHTYSTEL